MTAKGTQTARLDPDDVRACKEVFDAWAKKPYGRLEPRSTGAAIMTDLKSVITDTGICCRVPHHAETGDEVVIFPDGKVSLLIRAEGRVDPTLEDVVCHIVIVTVYAHGLIDGEAARVVEEKRLEESSFVIV